MQLLRYTPSHVISRVNSDMFEASLKRMEILVTCLVLAQRRDQQLKLLPFKHALFEFEFDLNLILTRV